MKAFDMKGDLFIGLSTSRSSANAVAISEVTREQGLTVIGMAGESDGKLEALCNERLKIPSRKTVQIERDLFS